MNNDKNILRKKSKEIRRNLDIEKISEKIIKKIENLDCFSSAKDVMIFYPLTDEINLLPLTKYTDKRFYLPRVNGDRIECCRFDVTKYNNEILKQVQNDKELYGLKCGRYGIMEPTTECIHCPTLDIVFVPALAVDNKMNRLGYGGGFYDRFLKEIHTTKIVPISKELVFENIPTEEFDVAMDMIVTD